MSSVFIDMNHVAREVLESHYAMCSDKTLALEVESLAKKLAKPSSEDYDAIRCLKALLSYCSLRGVDLNKYISLEIS